MLAEISRIVFITLNTDIIYEVTIPEDTAKVLQVKHGSDAITFEIQFSFEYMEEVEPKNYLKKKSIVSQ